ncbi:G-type lectin S-receptor-like serine/threonine-protein kinase At5g35370 [Rhododendron vialii]|uniref:G-type lectin S-receptor-like serine/threonine-protein kinase At5g35370 n=1 Tax=Rhododendron vialii TaxID=182163 RepID=UPI00265E363C|nr:G-type lectin S-receptor-like serine/threonine-protein kinase At5g35370 [Rhododendron vialii]
MKKARADHFHLLLSLADMGSFPFIFLILLSFCVIVSCSTPSSDVVLYPNYTASGVHFIDGSVGFLTSPNGTFRAAILSPGGQGGSGTNYYLCILHVPSNTITWSANRNAPVSIAGTMTLSVTGIVMKDHDGSLKWSTPLLDSSVSSLQLTETGNLVLLTQSNAILWESFLHPTDTIVMGQELPVGVSLSSAVSSTDLSVGSYTLSITASDALLQWQNLTYWKLSMNTVAYATSSYPVEYMAVNQTGLYLFGNNGSVVVIQVNLSISDFGIAKLDYSGQFSVGSFSGTNFKPAFAGPDDKCQIPFICGTLGLCGDGSNNRVCSCSSNFRSSSQSQYPNCVPSDASYSLSNSCNSTDNSNTGNFSLSYLSLDYGNDYFTNDFTNPVKYGVNLSGCEDLCSSECSCLGIFYDNSSNSCYVLENQLGSLMSSTSSRNDRLGFVKVIVGPSPPNFAPNSGQPLGIPIVALVLPFIGFFLLATLGFFFWRRSRSSKTGKLNLNSQTIPSSEDLDAFSIPGLPVRFGYEELEVATDKFKTMIGSGGFGTVYKGTLPDKSHVAVKKITNVGIQGKKDFCTEIAIIGNIHHVNLVKLRGFCAQGRERLLVYEYMNRGSLDRTLFGNGPVLEWKERVEIALGTARGLAYLHSGCQQKIIHCDVKPENILLHDHFQAKISDFGLSKLLSSEQSGLFTTMRGTRGYLAPEWLTSAAISDKTDIYSFGMVLLEIVNGRKNCSLRTRSECMEDEISGGGSSSSSSRQGSVYFPMFALEMHEQGRYLELADPRLEGRVTSEDVAKLVRVALCCAHEDPALRPSMVSVVSMLEGEIPSGQPKLESLNFLRFYGRRFAEASTIEQNNGQDDFIFPQLNASLSSSTSRLPLNFSFISSQQVSGPR